MTYLHNLQPRVNGEVADYANDATLHCGVKLHMSQVAEFKPRKKAARRHFIAEWAAHRGVKQTDLIRVLGADKGTVSRWFAGNIPQDKYLRPLEEFLRVDVGGLFQHPSKDEPDIGPLEVPLISWVSAGELVSPDVVDDLANAQRIQAPKLPKGDWIALEVVGDSMDRISPPGSIIFVDLSDKQLVMNACYVFADEDGDATYKRYRPGPDRIEPVSTNTAHETRFPDRMPVVVGRVRKTMLDM